jgi:hypothetical protein
LFASVASGSSRCAASLSGQKKADTDYHYGRCKIGRFLVPRCGFVNGNLGVQSKQILLEPLAHQGYL